MLKNEFITKDIRKPKITLKYDQKLNKSEFIY